MRLLPPAAKDNYHGNASRMNDKTDSPTTFQSSRIADMPQPQLLNVLNKLESLLSRLGKIIYLHKDGAWSKWFLHTSRFDLMSW